MFSFNEHIKSNKNDSIQFNSIRSFDVDLVCKYSNQLIEFVVFVLCVGSVGNISVFIWWNKKMHDIIELKSTLH